MHSMFFFRVPYSFLLLGGIIGAMSLVRIVLTREPTPQVHTTETDGTVPGLSPIEVLKTRVFYLVR